MLPRRPSARVSHINHYLICFYDGRDIADHPASAALEGDWSTFARPIEVP